MFGSLHVRDTKNIFNTINIIEINKGSFNNMSIFILIFIFCNIQKKYT